MLIPIIINKRKTIMHLLEVLMKEQEDNKTHKHRINHHPKVSLLLPKSGESLIFKIPMSVSNKFVMYQSALIEKEKRMINEEVTYLLTEKVVAGQVTGEGIKKTPAYETPLTSHELEKWR
jgi:hypothetical protein